MALTWFGFYLYRKGKLEHSKRYLKLVIWSVLLPYLAINAGWIVTEAGRQPWTVYKLMRTAEAVSPISMSQIIFSLASLVIFYSLLLVADVYLMLKYAKKGPAVATASEKGGIPHVS
jgi:cytochrome d ubiquinol oxidase subunit I